MLKTSQYLERMNITQRVSFGITSAIFILILLAHNPISGYVIEEDNSAWISVRLPACPDSEKESYKNMLTNIYKAQLPEDQRKTGTLSEEIINKINSQVKHCRLLRPGLPTNDEYTQELFKSVKPVPFDEWSSSSPLLPWIGNVLNFVYSLIAVLSIGAIFTLFVFKKTNKP